MGTQVDRLPVQGIAIPSDLISLDTLRPTDAATPASTYTQAGGAAGDSRNDDVTSRLELDLTGGQDAEIEVTVVQGGLPGVAGLGVAYRFTSESTADTVEEAWRGRAEPVAFADAMGHAEECKHYSLCVPAGSHDLLWLYVQIGGAVLGCKRWDGSDWGTPVSVSVPAIGGAASVADFDSVCSFALPDGDVLAVGRRTGNDLAVYRSQDYGVSWEEWADRAGTLTGTAPAMRGCYYRGDLLLISTLGDDLKQLVSTDLGATFAEIYSASGVVYDAATSIGKAACAAAPWGIVVAYVEITTGYLRARVLGAAGQPFNTATAVEISIAEAYTSVAVEVDAHGIVYVYAGADDRVQVFWSADHGVTWLLTGTPYLLRIGSTGSALYYPTNLVSAFYRGSLVLAQQVYSDPLGTPVLVEEPGVVLAMGWSNLLPVVTTGGSVASWLSSQWVCGSPAGMGWTATGLTGATVNVGRYVRWSVAASTGGFSVAPPTEPAVVAQATCRVAAGTPSVATFEHGIYVRKANGTYEYILEVRIGATSIVAYDRNGTVSLGTLTIDCTDWVQVYAVIDAANKAIVYARTAQSSRWLRVCAIATLTNNAATPAAAGLINWGVINSATCDVHWRAIAWDIAEKYRCGLTTVVPASSSHVFAPMDRGGLLSARGSALPDVGSSTRAALLSARRGPGRRGERVVISPVFDYALANVFPRLGESPDRVWRTTDKAAFSLVFDLGDDGGKLGHDWLRVLGLLRTNFRKAFLDSSTDGTTWTNRDIWDASTGFSTDLEYELQGQTIRPTTGSAAGARPLHRNELAGGFVILDNTYAFEIAGNSAGVWNAPSGTTKWAEIQIIGDPTPANSTGAVVICWPNGVHVGRFSGVSPTVVDRFWRLRTEANEATPWTYYQIGALFLGTPVTFGKRSSRAWQREVIPNASRSTSRYGTIRKRQDGPPAGRWTLGWADGEQQRFHRAGLTDVDYVRAGSSGPALAMRDDVYEALRGLLEETRGGEVPVIGLAAIPDTDQTITDRALFLYGSLDGGASFGQVEGREGYDAFGRVDPITIDEIR